MSEKEWLECSELWPMRALLLKKASQRKLTLFACACCRHIWPLLVDERSRTAIEVLEKFIDGQSSEADLNVAYGAHAASDGSYDVTFAWWAVGKAVAGAGGHWNRDPRIGSLEAATECLEAAGCANVRAGASEEVEGADCRIGEAAERQIQMGFLRDIIGNPFRPVSVDPAWLTWRDAAIPKIAQAIYIERSFADLPILVDALEEAGCTDADILEHCRQPGEHVRGCWVVDLLLGNT